MAIAILPLKDLVQAKSRLAGLLRPTERRRLAQAMAEDVLAVLSSHPQISRIVVVSDDPGATMLAKLFSAECWSERDLGCSGLNSVLERACQKLISQSSETVLVLHADLPLLATEDIDAVLAAQERRTRLVIGPDRHGRGTNLLAFSPPVMPLFMFGKDSRRRHERGACEQGLSVTIVERVGIGLDIDEPGDLAFLLALSNPLPGPETRRLLLESGLATRLALALASIEEDSAGATMVSGADVVGESSS